MNDVRRRGGARALREVRKVFRQGGVELAVLNGIDLALAPGEIVALVGPSGAGKSTMLHVAGLLERPDGGAVLIEGRDCGSLSDEHRTLLRRRALGFVYQFHHLLAGILGARKRDAAADDRRRRAAPARDKAAALLERVGLGERLSHRPARLSGGEQQRVALVRALANDPKILLADEPTGNLDHTTGERASWRLLIEIVRARGLAALIATHNLELAQPPRPHRRARGRRLRAARGGTALRGAQRRSLGQWRSRPRDCVAPHAMTAAGAWLDPIVLVPLRNRGI